MLCALNQLFALTIKALTRRVKCLLKRGINQQHRMKKHVFIAYTSIYFAPWYDTDFKKIVLTQNGQQIRPQDNNKDVCLLSFARK